MDKEMISHSAEETVRLGNIFAKERLSKGSVLCLRGELGAGKTQFAKGIATCFGLDGDEIGSPTYALVNEYEISSRSIERLYHLDCYRFEKPDELLELGIEEYLYPKHAVTIIEWPERIEKFLPPGRIEVLFTVVDENTRKLVVSSQ